MRSRSHCTRPAWSISTASPSFSASRARRRSPSSGTAYSSTRRRGRSGFEAWRTADAYLSGPVRKKLEIAIDAAFEDPRFERNVEALKEALPEDLKPSEITARLGAPWIPADVVAGFCEEILGITTRVFHTVEIASWTIEVNAFLRNPASTTDWGTLRRHAGELLSDAL